MADTDLGEKPSEKLKVFISYSRRDSGDFAEEIVAGLELAGFAPFLESPRRRAADRNIHIRFHVAKHKRP